MVYSRVWVVFLLFFLAVAISGTGQEELASIFYVICFFILVK